MFEDFKTKPSVVVVYTGEGKGKTSAGLGLLVRALGTGWRVAFVQFIKHWEVGEHQFIKDIEPIYKDNLKMFRGGKGFYDAGEMSAAGITDDQHKQAAQETLDFAIKASQNGEFDLVICDEINNAMYDGLIKAEQVKDMIKNRNTDTSLCLTGRDFPKNLLVDVDIATNMTKLKHHFDDKFMANKGIDY